jgi:hypothetical protein
MSRRNLILIGLGLALMVASTMAYAVLFGPQTAMGLFARYAYRNSPKVSETPVALADTSTSATPHRKISYFGYELELPWDDVDEQKSKTVGQIRVTAFLSGRAFWFSSYPPKEFINALIQIAKFTPDTFKQTYGEEAAESDYSFYRAMLHLTPTSITPFMSRQLAARDSALLFVKALSMPPAGPGIFDIQTGNFRGFQFGDPKSRPQRICDELYSQDGGIDLIFFQKSDGSAPSVSQPEINRILQSIHNVPAANPVAGVRRAN